MMQRYNYTLVVENGKMVENENIANDEWKRGILTDKK